MNAARVPMERGPLRGIALSMLLLCVTWVLLVASERSRAGEPITEGLSAGGRKAAELNRVSPWLGTQLSEASKFESYYCSCYDEPIKHYPYPIVVLKTPNGDLVARPEGTDGTLFFTPLAVRYGNRYCEVGSETDCYGSFAHPCEFTDFRYGPYLAEFFPTCKSE